MQLLPALDLLGDDAVRLFRGDYDRVLFRRPATEFLERLVATAPALIHLVDLQGARDGTFRFEMLARCVRAANGTPLQVSGGLRTLEAAQRALAGGATRCVIGTALWNDEGDLASFVDGLGDALVAALDVRDGRLAVRGWRQESPLTLENALSRCVATGVTRLHVTAIDRDGTMNGPDLDLYEKACASGLAVVAAGGVRDERDLATLERVGCEAAVMGVGYLERLGINLEE